ncbi:LEAF RUST 10 DISEASE-RESISTANCE LOCUS RECEPTOR-LIKE PROTEIN KINASE-like 1.1 isoform X2 [Folsomia candida]|uniref:LEAF RUST 10 DISEASE-RESISTANCE LOCUS RECEPTOR-LIKE PROTEIN KINASE-like 1.1 isoform X2 n=1 Tax=Folsomia candida TaxID=158441 RepID=UPI0016052B3A|nr:LEAF RUST 10 DISEASE-RESISTANCE LOCUS RECEPTOR-LIKE PROTEIN KINASE-like 1.1 isoform X2 [Folsomia candida]
MRVHFTLYEDKFFDCDTEGGSSGACETFIIQKCSNLYFYEDRVSSINTFENCIIIWENLNCEGDWTEVGPETWHHDNLSSLKMSDGIRTWDDRMSSVSICENNCVSSGFVCSDKKCIKSGAICDGENDCGDGADESNCTSKTIYPQTREEIPEIVISPSKLTTEKEQISATPEISTIPSTNCSTNGTYCERDGKCIPISNISNCALTDVKNNGEKLDPGSLYLTTGSVLTLVLIAIVVFIMIGICMAVYLIRKKKRNNRSIKSPSDIPLQPIPAVVQHLLPPPHPIIHLTPPWQSNPSLTCISLLGEGFFGKVYQVEDQAAIVPPTRYAIKCVDMAKTLRSCSGPSNTSSATSSTTFPGTISLQNSMNLLLNEMQIMDQLSSDHVVRYYGCWAEAEDCSQLVLTKSRLEEYIHELIEDSNNSATSTQNSPLSHIFIRMELCHSTLKHYLQAYPEQGGDEISIVQQVATGLLYVHSKGYIHRDIKPGNIFFKVESSSGKLTWKIGDFGLAVMSRDEGNVGAAGTYLYQSPEMRERLRYTDKTDLYSLGLVWVEILSRDLDRSAVFVHLRNFSGIERRKYLNNCCRGKFKKVVKIVDQLLIADPESRICSDKLCNLLKCFNANDTFKSV